MNQKVEKIDLGYTPRPLQAKLHSLVRRFNVLVCHRRFGKTVWAIFELLDRSLQNQNKNPQYAYIAPYFTQAKKIAWDYLKDAVKNIPGVTINESELRVDIPRPWLGDRIRIMLLGAENPNAIRGMYLDGVILDEYAEMLPTIFTTVLRPLLSDRLGWCIFMGTPKGQNHFYETYKYARDSGNPNWFAALFKASETGLVAKTELDEARSLMSDEEYEQEFECSFTAALVGAYYAKQMGEAVKQNRIGNVPYDPSVPVSTFWDLGIGDSMSIWFVQHVFREYRVIDYIEDSGMELGHYVKKLKERDYFYGRHFLPHDATARELQTGKNRIEALELLGLNRRDLEVTPKHAVDDGISQVRMTIPMCYFDRVKCERGIEALLNYRKKWDEKNQIFSSAPLHNWASHGADAFRIFAMNTQGFTMAERRRNLPTRQDNSYNPLD